MWFAVVNWFSVINSAYTHDKFIMICAPNSQWWFMPFEQKILGITFCFALYLAKNNAPVHAFFISFLSLKRYYSIILFIILGAWSQGIKRGYVSIVICTCESRLSHARAECVNLYQSICYYIQRLHSCFPGNGLGIGLDKSFTWIDWSWSLCQWHIVTIHFLNGIAISIDAFILVNSVIFQKKITA